MGDRMNGLPPLWRVVDAEDYTSYLTKAPPLAPGEGVKHDADKPTFDYLPDDALAEINKVMVYGAQKYSARNWEAGMAWTRPWNACLRHLWAWARREPCDPETGLSHLAHAGCCILFLIAFELRQIGTDNRLPATRVTPEVT